MPRLYIRLTVDTDTSNPQHARDILAEVARRLAEAHIPSEGTTRAPLAQVQAAGHAGTIGTITVACEKG